MSPTEITCSKIGYLNNSKGKCTAKGVEWINGKCFAYIGSRNGMQSDVVPMERRHGSLANKPNRLP